MDLIHLFFDYFLHLDRYLGAVISDYGVWTYLIVFAIVFCETGLVVTPILPGDSLLFAVGTFAAIGALDVVWAFTLLSAAAVAGDTVNYWAGFYVGPHIFEQQRVRFIRKEHLDRTHEFYERHGGKTIIIARFIPIIRTFAPFVAGIGRMSYFRFISYNVIGGVGWIALFVLGGYYFGNIAAVKENFSFVIVAIIFISILPAAIEFARQRYRPDPAC